MNKLLLNTWVATYLLSALVPVGLVILLVVLAILLLMYSRKLNSVNDHLEPYTDRWFLLLLLIAFLTLGAFIVFILYV